MTWNTLYFVVLSAGALVVLGLDLISWRHRRQERRRRQRAWAEHVARSVTLAESQRVPWRRP